jgi:16S rRNA (cytosine967-C5)-methyltransferase
MTPGARVQAAIELLDRMAEGVAAEAALTTWARRSRFAGSKDRAAVRDHVFDVLRQKRLAAALGGGDSGRALMLGKLRAEQVDPDAFFTGQGHAPAPLTGAERDLARPTLDRATRWNLPDWLADRFAEDLGDTAENAALILQARAPIALRVNRRRATREAAQAALRAEGIETAILPGHPHALLVSSGARGISRSPAFLQGLVELQDVHSQAVAEDLPEARKVLDYCAGGGGKALAIADRMRAEVFAHDADPGRMKDIPHRAARAGVEIRPIDTDALVRHAPFDLVLCDAPCSGSGSWRRAPEAKWSLTPAALDALARRQDTILDTAMHLVGEGGTLVYATCSVLADENEARVARFIDAHPAWRCVFQHRYPLTSDADGFYAAHFQRQS